MFLSATWCPLQWSDDTLEGTNSCSGMFIDACRDHGMETIWRHRAREEYGCVHTSKRYMFKDGNILNKMWRQTSQHAQKVEESKQSFRDKSVIVWLNSYVMWCVCLSRRHMRFLGFFFPFLWLYFCSLWVLFSESQDLLL